MGLALNRASAEKSTLRNPQLDGVRGIAILLIIIWHYGASKMGPQPSPFADSIVRALGVTISGVDLFFVLSGFLIGGILLDNKESPHYFKTFYLRRACRIFPLYFAWLLLFIIIYGSDSALIRTTPLRELFVNPLPIW